MTAVHTVPAVTAALITQGTVTVITAPERGVDGHILIRTAARCTHEFPLPWWMSPDQESPCRCTLDLGHDGDHSCEHLGGPPPPTHPGCIVASATVEWVRITDRRYMPDHGPRVTINPATGTLRYVGSALSGIFDDITDQLPWGDFTPGRWAGILTDVKPTTERCPVCWGLKGAWGPMGDVWYPCQPCADHGTCPPIPCDNETEWP